MSRAGTINNGVTANYCYDKADNRSQVAVSSGACVAAGSASSFVIGDGSASEGDPATFTVTRYGDTGTAQAVSYASAGGTAISGTDFTAGAGTLSFAAGETVKSVIVATIQDYLYEGNEGFVVNLSGATGGAIISDSQGVGTIVDDEPPIPPGFSVSDASAAEGAGLVFTVTRSGTAVSSLSINYATANGSAVAGTEYTAASGTLTFAQSETSKTVTVATIDDPYVEPTKTMIMNLSLATGGASIIDGTGTGTITDNDAPPPPPTGLVISDSSATEGQSMTFTVSRTDTTAAVSVDYATADGTAVAPSDYTATSGTLNFAIGEGSKTIIIATKQNSIYEETEEFNVNLSNPTGGATIGDGLGVGTIFDDDPDPCPNCRTQSAPATGTTEEVPPAEPPPGGGL